MTTFGERLKALRNEKKLKQEDLAIKLNISKSAIGMYERNEREPSFEITKKIANFFDVTIDYLINGKENTNTNTDNGNLFFFDMDGLTDDEIEDIKRHINYVKWKSEQERNK
ncbi:helix-turn-helix domain-containing protein [Niallia sp. 03091]|uniref:helix-turn-helix domain-containing protein n=1 Tax=unclassified Niallia TaxID=2837522 RepID=UPI004044247A